AWLTWFLAKNSELYGAAIVELAVVAPVLTVLGLSAAQYSSLFFAKNQVNHAAFLAARAGSVGNASIDAIKQAYIQGLVPMYGGGSTPAELAKSLANATEAVNGKDGPGAYIEMLNPTKEAFEDWNDEKLQTLLDTKGKRVISNRGLGLSTDAVRANSGESRQDANLIKLRIMQGIKPAVPVVGSIYTAYLKYLDTGSDANRSALIQKGLIPVVTNVTMQMQSDAIEPDHPVSSPGSGNGGNPVDPGEPPTTPTNPTQPCSESSNPTGCDLPSDPDPGGGGGACEVPVKAEMSADALFDFDSATLSPTGKSNLAQFMAPYLNKTFDKVVINGYTDPLGNDAYNIDLSQRRADAVALYLNQLGLKVMDVPVVRGKGATSPKVNPDDCKNKTGDDLKACYAPDRRVTIELTPHS
ncbi:OmpA family protein, partial [Pseudoduganella sp. FT9W]|uniref:OmpA family protein n=1 Tax=Duganella alba TaxID=2666081 RepID=UPI0012AEF146